MKLSYTVIVGQYFSLKISEMVQLLTLTSAPVHGFRLFWASFFFPGNVCMTFTSFVSTIDL